VEQPQEKTNNGPQGRGDSDELTVKFKKVSQGPDGALLLSLLDILYERLTELEYDDQHLSADDLEAIRKGQEDIKQGRCLTLEEYRTGKRL
jgi:hypothetical protein